MSKRSRLRQEVRREEENRRRDSGLPPEKWKDIVLAEGIVIPCPKMLDIIGGYDTKLYPRNEQIPQEYKSTQHPLQKRASAIFFEGFNLQRLSMHDAVYADSGYTLREGYDIHLIAGALRAFLGSFDISHNTKISGAAWLLATVSEKVAGGTQNDHT